MDKKMKFVWLLYATIGFSDTAAEPRTEIFRTNSEEQCWSEVKRIRDEIITVYGEEYTELDLRCVKSPELVRRR
tara:strand:+ start:330 stop:551 length:222 start_codon:yes stop_codon:yes gene_type:complete